jgi:2-polyprenyl-3-methyl-5-hydroxy-6-metoxy-1,4-benzoquinol methylase
MSNLIHYTHCPVCGSTDIVPCLSAKDYTVSAETFVVVECHSCTLRFTQDVPDAAAILPYYRSEEYISHTNTSKGLINRMYQHVRRQTMRRKRKLVSQVTGLKEGTILDIGSGTGTFVQAMKQAGWEAKGLEPDVSARELAKKVHDLELSGMEEFLKLPVRGFDAITLWHVLEHVDDLSAYMQQLEKLLKENGKLIIAVPNYTSKDAEIYKEYWAAYDLPRHLYHFSPHSMEMLIKKNGLKLLQVKPMWYDSFYISLLSSKYKNGKANLFAAFWIGLRSNLKAMGDAKRCSSVIYIIGK